MTGRHRPGARSRSSAKVHWFVLAAAVAVLAMALVVQGYTHHLYEVTEDASRAQAASETVPSSAVQGGPVIDVREGSAATTTPPERTIALTFDDGPDPVWTPRILDLLRRHHVRATFFVVGTEAAAHRDLVRRMRAEGHEVGVHTLTHADLGSLPRWQQRLEISTTQQILVDITGEKTALLRPPFVSTNAELNDTAWSAITTADELGYVSVLSTLDAKDWRRPGVATISRNLTPKGTGGQIALLHDAGGDRSQTLSALEQQLPLLEAKGYRFDTVSGATGLTGTVTTASRTERFTSATISGILRGSDWLVRGLGFLLVASGVVTFFRAALVLIAAARHRRSHRRVREAVRGTVTEQVSVIVPAYNESAGIEAAVRSIVASNHPVEIIVVDDGSTDGTADLVEALGLPGVQVIRKANGGKPSALNEGLRVASHDLVVMVDGDTVFEPSTIRNLVQRFSDPAVGAVSGNTKVANRGGILGRWQHIEYVIGFNLDRRLFDIAECMPTVPGAIGGFRRSAILDLGGVSDDTLAEDTDLTMALCRDGWRVVYEDRAIAWTEAPASLGELWKQRYRWCYGTLQAMWKHRGAVKQRGAAGKLGRRGLSYLLLLQVLLPMLAPAVDVFAVYGLVFLDPVRVMGVWLAFLAVQALMAIYAFRLDGERLGPLWTMPLQQVVYRQLMYLVVIQSVFTAFTGTYLRWHRMERYGSLAAPAAR